MMKKIHLFFVSSLLVVQNVWAQVESDLDGIIPSGKSDDQTLNYLAGRVEMGTLHVTDILYFIVKLIDLVSGLAGTFCVLMLLYAGFQYMVSGLNDEKEAAKKTLSYAITGLIVSFLAYLIVNILFVQFTGEGLEWNTVWGPKS